MGEAVAQLPLSPQDSSAVLVDHTAAVAEVVAAELLPAEVVAQEAQEASAPFM